MLPATAFYLLRHGESEANVAHVAAGGGVDSPLTELGRQQAQELANVIVHLKEKPSAIFVSPMQRARDTAKIVNSKLGLPLQIVKDLDEHRFGDWEGVDWNTIKDKVHNGEDPPNGETYSEYAQRVQRVLTPVLERAYAAPPLIVAHGGTFYAIANLYNWKITGVKNCHLHLFNPFSGNEKNPWKIHEFNAAENDLHQVNSPFCPQNEQISL